MKRHLVYLHRPSCKSLPLIPVKVLVLVEPGRLLAEGVAMAGQGCSGSRGRCGRPGGRMDTEGWTAHVR